MKPCFIMCSCHVSAACTLPHPQVQRAGEATGAMSGKAPASFFGDVGPRCNACCHYLFACRALQACTRAHLPCTCTLALRLFERFPHLSTALLKGAPLALLGRGRVVLLRAAAAAAIGPAAGRRGTRAGAPPRRWAVSRPLRALVLAFPAATVRADPPPAGAAAAAASALAPRERVIASRGRHFLARGGPSAVWRRLLPV